MLKDIKLKDYVKKYGNNWADEMPENCPPEDVCTADNDVFYRFTKKADVIEPRDWLNHRNLYPNRQWTKEEIILAAGLSGEASAWLVMEYNMLKIVRLNIIIEYKCFLKYFSYLCAQKQYCILKKEKVAVELRNE